MKQRIYIMKKKGWQNERDKEKRKEKGWQNEYFFFLIKGERRRIKYNFEFCILTTVNCYQ